MESSKPTRPSVFGELEFTVNPFFNNFRVNGEFQGKWLNVGGSVTTVTPTLVQNSMFNNGFRWENENTSKNVKTTNIYAYTNLKFGQITLHPNADLNWISSYIYFDENAFAEQTDNEILIYKIGLGLDYRLKKFSTTNQFLFSKSNNEDLIKIPTFNFTTRLAFDLLYKKKLFIQTGFDINYQSGYQGYAYMPAIQQFHLQRESQGQSVYNIQGYAQVDVFADVRINRVRLSLKFANANYRLPLNGSGYYASPGFSGMGRVLAFGLHWLLFD